MSEPGLITQLGELLALCGVTSVRCFMPTFAVCLLCRFGLPFGLHSTELTQLTHQIPNAMMSDGGLLVLGCMAALELLANWNQTVRELFSDFNWENYVKPVYAFVFAVVVGAPESAAPAVASAVAQGVPLDTVPNADGFSLWGWITTIVPAGLSAFGTHLLCSFKRKIMDMVRAIDPDNSFKLQSIACAAEESAWVILVLVAVLVPVLAIFVMLIAAGLGYAVKQILKALEDKNSHDCPTCAGRVHNSAVKCPNCRTNQPTPYCAVGFRGLAAKETVDASQPAQVHRHHLRLLLEHRCPICATPLTDQQTCSHCGTPIWEQGVTRQEIVKLLDSRMIWGVIGGFFASNVPVLGFVATVVYFNMRCLRILRGYESRGSLFVTRVLFSFAKWTILIFSCIFSAIPWVGILFMVPYGFSYWRSRARFLKKVDLVKGVSKMFCSSCGKQCSETSVFCPSCGAALKKEAAAPTAAEPKAVAVEGTAASPEAPSAAPEASSASTGNTNYPGNPPNSPQMSAALASAGHTKIVAGVLAIFLGTFGVHKFYLGYTVSGIIMLAINIISCCLFAPVMQILGIVEGIIYITKSDADFKKIYIDSKKEWL